MIKKAIYKIRDRKIPKPIRDRIPEKWSGQSFIPPGWRGIVLLLDAELAEVIPNYELHQCKQKFGSLRYYIDWENIADPKIKNKVSSILNKYEELSENVCEVCGRSGEKQTIPETYFIVTRCDKHSEK